MIIRFFLLTTYPNKFIIEKDNPIDTYSFYMIILFIYRIQICYMLHHGSTNKIYISYSYYIIKFVEWLLQMIFFT